MNPYKRSIQNKPSKASRPSSQRPPKKVDIHLIANYAERPIELELYFETTKQQQSKWKFCYFWDEEKFKNGKLANRFQMRMYRTTSSRCPAPNYTEFYGRGNAMTTHLRKSFQFQYEAIKLTQVIIKNAEIFHFCFFHAFFCSPPGNGGLWMLVTWIRNFCILHYFYTLNCFHVRISLFFLQNKTKNCTLTFTKKKR